jgi:hypothetical protein
VAALRETAAALVADILAVGEETRELLRKAQEARTRLGQSLGTGETTLAAYRRVVAPQTPAASLVSTQG